MSPFSRRQYFGSLADCRTWQLHQAGANSFSIAGKFSAPLPMTDDELADVLAMRPRLTGYRVEMQHMWCGAKQIRSQALIAALGRKAESCRAGSK
jgi:hypothetical protein